jgi:predicted DCC family thiol-disulfide oxidoreductase YuxK
MQSAPAVLIYDEGCGLCQRSVAWARRAAMPNRLEFVACRSEERVRRFPQFSEDACMAAMVLALPDGRVLAGADAIPDLLRVMKGWRWLSYVFAAPGMRLVSRPVYGWLAKNRYSLSCLLRSQPKKEEAHV